MTFSEIFCVDVENPNGNRRYRGELDRLHFQGEFWRVLHERDGIILGNYPIRNLVVNSGKNSILDIMFNGATQIAQANWAIGLIDNSGFTAIAVTDTIGTHTGWVEFTGYNQTTRVAWGQGSSSSQNVTNGTPANFDINASGTINGVFITSSNTKGGTSGLLWSAGSFSAAVPVVNGDSLKISYGISC